MEADFYGVEGVADWGVLAVHRIADVSRGDKKRPGTQCLKPMQLSHCSLARHVVFWREEDIPVSFATPENTPATKPL